MSKKTLKSLLYGIPIAFASFLPLKEAKGQMEKSNFFSNIWEDENRIEKPNALYLVFQPCDLGLGLRYDKRFDFNLKDRKISNLGAYFSLSRGKYGLGEGEYIKNHIKMALGGLIYFKESPEGVIGFLNCGISYNTYGKNLILKEL